MKAVGAVVSVVVVVACASSTPPPKNDAPAGGGVAAGGSAAAVVDLACGSDSDCVTFSDDIDGATRCCPGCTNHASNATWRAAFEKDCKAHPPAQCPALGCAMAVVHAACVDKQCVAK